RNIGSALRALQRDLPRRLRELRPDAPRELDDLIARMLNRDPARRPSPPLAISTALAPFTVAPTRADGEPVRASGSREQILAAEAEDDSGRRRVLIVEDDRAMRKLACEALEGIGCTCVEVGDGESALAA